ncbi:MAG: nitroreductase family protein [Deferrisomatales bacterium]
MTAVRAFQERWRRWLDAVPRRVSRRRFDPAPVGAGALDALDRVCLGFRPFGPARVVLLREAPGDLFRGVVGSYGKVKGAPHALVMAGPGDAAAEVGYVGEAAVLEATALGLDTCWVGGLFDPDRAAALARLGPGERVFAVSPVGRAVSGKGLEERLMSAVARSRSRKPLETLAPGVARWPDWARAGAEAARLAPSALNRQPWRFAWEGPEVVLSADAPRDTYHIPKRLDCGIAMLHFELGARGGGVAGDWRWERPPRVARFLPAAR